MLPIISLFFPIPPVGSIGSCKASWNTFPTEKLLGLFLFVLDLNFSGNIGWFDLYYIFYYLSYVTKSSNNLSNAYYELKLYSFYIVYIYNYSLIWFDYNSLLFLLILFYLVFLHITYNIIIHFIFYKWIFPLSLPKNHIKIEWFILLLIKVFIPVIL